MSDERRQHGWLHVPLIGDDTPPLHNKQCLEWLRIRRSYDSETIEECELRTVASDRIPEPTDFASAVETERAAQDAVDRIAELKSHPAYEGISNWDASVRASLRSTLLELEEHRHVMQQVDTPWGVDAVKAILTGHRAVWASLLDRSRVLTSSIEMSLSVIRNTVLSITKRRERRKARSDISIVQRHFATGGGWKVFGIFTPRAVKAQMYLKEEVRIDGQGLVEVDMLDLAAAHLDMEFAVEELERLWSDLGELPPGVDVRVRIAAITEHLEQLERSIEYGDRCRDCGMQMAAATPSIPEPNWLEGETVSYLEILDASPIEERLSHSRDDFEAILSELNSVVALHDSHSIVRSQMEAVTDRNVTGYSEGYGRLLQIEQTRVDQKVAARIESEINKFIPDLVASVLESQDDDSWDERFSEFEAA